MEKILQTSTMNKKEFVIVFLLWVLLPVWIFLIIIEKVYDFMKKKNLRVCEVCKKDIACNRTVRARFCKKCYAKRVKEKTKIYKQKYYQKNKQKLKQKRDENKK